MSPSGVHLYYNYLKTKGAHKWPPHYHSIQYQRNSKQIYFLCYWL